MRTLLTSLLLALLATTVSAQDATIRVMTYNIRCGFCEPLDSPNHWSKRKFLVAHLIKNENPDIIGFQEAERFQIEDLASMLEDYQWVGIGRDDGNQKGEANAIFFRKSRFTLENTKTLWLSATPEKVSRGWDASFNRTLTIATIKDTQNNQIWNFFNTHFDHLGVEAQKHSAKFLLEELKKVSPRIPTVVTGDFNVSPDNVVYQTLEKSTLLTDAAVTSGTQRIVTFNNFGKDSPANQKIDFIFINPAVTVIDHKINQMRYNELYPSDHYPIITLLKPIQEQTRQH